MPLFVFYGVEARLRLELLPLARLGGAGAARRGRRASRSRRRCSRRAGCACAWPLRIASSTCRSCSRCSPSCATSPAPIESLPFAISPWPVVPIFGLEVGGAPRRGLAARDGRRPRGDRGRAAGPAAASRLAAALVAVALPLGCCSRLGSRLCAASLPRRAAAFRGAGAGLRRSRSPRPRARRRAATPTRTRAARLLVGAGAALGAPADRLGQGRGAPRLLRDARAAARARSSTRSTPTSTARGIVPGRARAAGGERATSSAIPRPAIGFALPGRRRVPLPELRHELPARVPGAALGPVRLHPALLEDEEDVAGEVGGPGRGLRTRAGGDPGGSRGPAGSARGGRRRGDPAGRSVVLPVEAARSSGRPVAGAADLRRASASTARGASAPPSAASTSGSAPTTSSRGGCARATCPSAGRASTARARTSIYDAAIELRGLILKGCQFLGSRADVLPREYVEVLSRLQDRVPPRPFAVVQAYVERELGASSTTCSLEFEREPIASASLAQVHAGRAPRRRRVAVKVQYPEIAALVRSDLANLRVLFRAVGLLERDFDLMPLVDELASSDAARARLRERGPQRRGGRRACSATATTSRSRASTGSSPRAACS